MSVVKSRCQTGVGQCNTCGMLHKCLLQSLIYPLEVERGYPRERGARERESVGLERGRA